jgi:hypothetical protein
LPVEAFTAGSGDSSEESVHLDRVCEYNRDPELLRDLLLSRLTLEAQKRVASSALSKREIIRRLGTSAPQLYRLLDQTNYRISIGKRVRLLYVVGCDVDLVVRERSRRPA